MINQATPAIRNLAEWLLLREAQAGTSSETSMQAVFRVCEKLRQPLTTLAGTAGYRSVLSRSLALARSEVPWLTALQIKPDGSLEPGGSVASELNKDEIMKGGVAFVAQILGLLAILIGENLTLRLVRDVWQDAPAEIANSRTEEKV
jgi:hypothetical protein